MVVHRAPTPTGSAGNGADRFPTWDEMESMVERIVGSLMPAVSKLTVWPPPWGRNVPVPVSPSNSSRLAWVSLTTAGSVPAVPVTVTSLNVTE